MKTINVTFEDKEFKKLSNFKGDKINWRDFILLMYIHCLDAEVKGDFSIVR